MEGDPPLNCTVITLQQPPNVKLSISLYTYATVPVVEDPLFDSVILSLSTQQLNFPSLACLSLEADPLFPANATEMSNIFQNTGDSLINCQETSPRIKMLEHCGRVCSVTCPLNLFLCLTYNDTS